MPSSNGTPHRLSPRRVPPLLFSSLLFSLLFPFLPSSSSLLSFLSSFPFFLSDGTTYIIHYTRTFRLASATLLPFGPLFPLSFLFLPFSSSRCLRTCRFHWVLFSTPSPRRPANSGIPRKDKVKAAPTFRTLLGHGRRCGEESKEFPWKWNFFAGQTGSLIGHGKAILLSFTWRPKIPTSKHRVFGKHDPILEVLIIFTLLVKRSKKRPMNISPFDELTFIVNFRSISKMNLSVMHTECTIEERAQIQSIN